MCTPVDPSDEFPWAAPRGIAVKASRDAGRYLVATKHFKAGDVVLRNAPVTVLLHAFNTPTHCAKCFKTLESEKRCAACKITRYCSADCQRADWKNHKLECKSMAKLMEAIDGTSSLGMSPGALSDALLLGRVLRWCDKNKKVESTDDVIYPTVADVQNLVVDENVLKDTQSMARWKKLAEVTRRVAPDLLPDGKGTSVEQLQRMLVQFNCNNFSVTDLLYIDHGAGVYPIGALLNHSCNASCVLTYDPETHVQVIRAVVDIEPGDEITHSYFEVGLPHWVRQARIKQHYGFDCRCQRCISKAYHAVEFRLVADKGLKWAILTDESTTGAKLPEGVDFKTPTRVDIDPAEISSMLHAARIESELAHNAAVSANGLSQVGGHEIYHAEKAVNEMTKLLHPRHIELQRAVAAAFNAFMVVGDAGIQQSIKYCEWLCDNYEIYDRPHPVRGLQLYTLGDLLCDAGRPAEGIRKYMDSYEILRITHGANNPTVVGLFEKVKSMGA